MGSIVAGLFSTHVPRLMIFDPEQRRQYMKSPVTSFYDVLPQLREARIPIVSVFLSGRPLQVQPEIEASDAFVAAWLPGTEGAGIADVLIGDAGGTPRYDFSGTLPFAWRNGATAGSVLMLR